MTSTTSNASSRPGPIPAPELLGPYEESTRAAWAAHLDEEHPAPVAEDDEPCETCVEFATAEATARRLDHDNRFVLLVADDGDLYEIGVVEPTQGYEAALRDLPVARFSPAPASGEVRFLLDFYTSPESQPHATREVTASQARDLMASPLEEHIARGREQMAAFYRDLTDQGDGAPHAVDPTPYGPAADIVVELTSSWLFAIRYPRMCRLRVLVSCTTCDVEEYGLTARTARHKLARWHTADACRAIVAEQRAALREVRQPAIVDYTTGEIIHQPGLEH